MIIKNRKKEKERGTRNEKKDLAPSEQKPAAGTGRQDESRQTREGLETGFASV
jgi:hypothetical protein